MERANLSLNRLLFFGYGWRYLSKRFDECALFRITLNAHTLTHSHNGTQTILETVHVQDDRVRASRLCRVWRSNVLHRRRRLEVRELARVVREQRRLLKKFSLGLSFVFPISFISLFLSAKERDKRKMKTKRARASLSLSFSHRSRADEGGVNVVARREHEKISYFFYFLSFLFTQKVLSVVRWKRHLNEKIRALEEKLTTEFTSLFLYEMKKIISLTTGPRLTATSLRLASPTTRKRNWATSSTSNSRKSAPRWKRPSLSASSNPSRRLRTCTRRFPAPSSKSTKR